MTTLPDFFNLPAKIAARNQIVRIYHRVTGKKSIPRDKQYWCLCGDQPITPGSEIIQMVRKGLVKKQQFHGVDLNEEKCKRNKIFHPEAHWYIGEWTEVVKNNIFNPAIIYLDTTSFANRYSSWNLTKLTLPLCPKFTLLFVNVILNNPRSHGKEFDPNEFVRGLKKIVPSIELEKWKDITYYEYRSTKHTKMGTFVYYKEG